MKIKKVEIFDIFVYAIVTFFVIITLYPFLNVAAVSLSSDKAVLLDPFMVIPKDIHIGAYKIILRNDLLVSSYKNTLIVTITSSALGILLTIMAAYPLSRREFKYKKPIMIYILITMYFHGGLIPSFVLIRNLGIYDTLWALIIPGSVSVFNIILMKNFFENDTIYALTESAKIDGANDPKILFHIVVPSAIPSIATITLFYMVAHWNAFFNALIYTRRNTNWTLQLLLREIVISANMNVNSGYDASIEYIPMINVKTATLVVTVLPILCAYPFLQKYFVKGVMVGAVKG